MLFPSGGMGKSGGLITFGEKVKGGNEVTLVNTNAYRTLYACPSVGVLQTISIYMKTALAGGDVCIGIYDGLVLLGHVTVAIALGDDKWFDVDFSGLGINLTAKTYGLAFKSMGAWVKCYFAAAPANTSEINSALVAGNHLPNPFAHNTHEAKKWSIHADVLT